MIICWYVCLSHYIGSLLRGRSTSFSKPGPGFADHVDTVIFVELKGDEFYRPCRCWTRDVFTYVTVSIQMRQKRCFEEAELIGESSSIPAGSLLTAHTWAVQAGTCYEVRMAARIAWCWWYIWFQDAVGRGCWLTNAFPTHLSRIPLKAYPSIQWELCNYVCVRTYVYIMCTHKTYIAVPQSSLQGLPFRNLFCI